jgi:hypothetical protein
LGDGVLMGWLLTCFFGLFDTSWWHDLYASMTRFITLGDGGSQVVSKPLFIIIIYDWWGVIFIGFVDVEEVKVLIPT